MKNNKKINWILILLALIVGICIGLFLNFLFPLDTQSGINI